MLTPFQQRIAELFFTATESAGFALAGGAALIVRGAIDRETHDLDFFANLHDVQDITPAVEATTAACVRIGLTVTPIQSSSTFARLEITDPETVESVLIDVALDAIDERPTMTVAGPTLTTKELAANKVSRCTAAWNRAISRTPGDSLSGSASGTSFAGQRRRTRVSTWRCSSTA